MNRKISAGVCLGIALIVAVISCIGTYFYIKKQYDDTLQGMPEKLKRYEYFDEVADIIDEHYYGQADKGTLNSALVKGYVDALGEGAQYLTQGEYSRYKREIQGDMDGIGVKYTETSKSKIKLTAVYDNSPAYLAGLKKGDIITAFDGIEVNEDNFDEMASKLTDTSTQSVNIIYKRDKKETSVTIKKGYEAQSVISDAYESIGYIDIREFYTETPDKLSEALDTFLLSGIKGVVIDLRSNKSQNYDNAIKALDVFVPMSTQEKSAASVINEKGEAIKTYSTTPGEFSLKICVLISDETSGAAELFADNMRGFSKATLYGSTTAGNALVQEVFELSDKGALLISVGKILPYSGVSFDEVGVAPDEKVENVEKSDNFKEDELFLKAAASLLD